MVWYENKEISIEEVQKLPEGNYILVRKGYGLVGGPVRAKSELINAVENTTLPKGKVEIRRFGWNFLNDVYIHPEKYIADKLEQERVRRLFN